MFIFPNEYGRLQNLPIFWANATFPGFAAAQLSKMYGVAQFLAKFCAAYRSRINHNYLLMICKAVI
jgi:predicted ATPase